MFNTSMILDSYLDTPLRMFLLSLYYFEGRRGVDGVRMKESEVNG